MPIVDDIAATLDRIEASQAELNAFITIDRAGAMAAAVAADQRRHEGQPLGALDGQPVAVKDNLDTEGLRTTYGLGLYRTRVPHHDADVVDRLRAAGAVIVGKTNMTELACGTVGANVHYGDVRHPRGDDHYPGGSSSGSGAAVGAGLVPLAIGTDTGGSIRHPAATCGIVGLKPTFGRTSNDGVSVCTRSMDHVGPMTATVPQAADLLAAIQVDGHGDPTGRLGTPIAGRAIAVLRGEFLDQCEPEVIRAFEAAIPLLESLGCTVTDLDLGLDLRQIDDEVANALGADLIDEYRELFALGGYDAFGHELWEWYSLYERVDPALYDRALERQRSLAAMVSGAVEPFDVVICPTTRTPTGTFAEGQTADRFDRVGNLAVWDITGHPSLTLPFGSDDAGMPLGLLLNGSLGDDATVLQIAHAIEQAAR